MQYKVPYKKTVRVCLSIVHVVTWKTNNSFQITNKSTLIKENCITYTQYFVCVWLNLKGFQKFYTVKKKKKNAEIYGTLPGTLAAR